MLIGLLLLLLFSLQTRILAEEAVESVQDVLGKSCSELEKDFGSYYGGRGLVYPKEHATLQQLATDFQAQLHELQHPADCSSARLLLYTPHECGLGAELHWTTVALTVAFVTKRTLVIREDRQWLYSQAPFCPAQQGAFSCYFEPLGSCVARSSDELAALLGDVDLAAVPILRTTELEATAHERVVHYTELLNEQLDFAFNRAVPEAWKTPLFNVRTNSHPLFWWRSQLVHYLWKLQPRVEQLLEARRQRVLQAAGVAPDAPLIGLHSRSGDKVHGSGLQPAEMKAIDARRKLAFVQAVATQCGERLSPGASFGGVYVATKDPAVLADVANSVDKHQSCDDDGEVHRYGRGFSTEDLVNGALNKTQEALDVLFDVHMLASCVAFVGTLESNLSRLVVEIAAANYRYIMAPLGSGPNVWWFAHP